MRKSHNVCLVETIEGEAKRYKGNLVIPLSSFGLNCDSMENGCSDRQGGMVFRDEAVALELLNALEKYFKKNKMTLRKEVSSWFHQKWSNLKLTIHVWFLQRKWAKERKLENNNE